MNIDRIARWYRWIEYAAYGRALERCRFAYLHQLRTCRKILILGEGDGRLLSRLLLCASEAEIDVVELSAEMIELAKHRILDFRRVRFFQQDAQFFSPQPATYDAIVTCFFLDCFAEPEAHEMVTKFAQALAPNGLWLLSEFAVPPRGWQHWHAKLWVNAMYRFFRLTTNLQASALPPIAKLLHQAGLTRIAKRKARAGLLIAEVWQKPATALFSSGR